MVASLDGVPTVPIGGSGVGKIVPREGSVEGSGRIDLASSFIPVTANHHCGFCLSVYPDSHCTLIENDSRVVGPHDHSD